MVRVLVIADEEVPALDAAKLRSIAPDILLAAGDLPWHYLEYVASAVNAPAAFVPGNHDPEVVRSKLTRKGFFVRDGVVCDAPRPIGLANADVDVLEVGGLRIAGLGGCVRYRPGPHQYTQTQYARRCRKLARLARRRGPVDVLLTHAPPLGLGDGEDAPHQGIAALHDLLEELEPAWHLHGHIHPHGFPQPDRVVGPTTIRNVVPYRILDIEPSTTKEHARA